MSFCKKCGNKLKEGARFCPKCGTNQMLRNTSSEKEGEDKTVESIQKERKTQPSQLKEREDQQAAVQRMPEIQSDSLQEETINSQAVPSAVETPDVKPVFPTAMQIEETQKSSLTTQAESSDKQHKIALCGTALLAISAFAPQISVPILGGIGLFSINKPVVAFLLMLVVFSVWTIQKKEYEPLMIVGNGIILAICVSIGYYYHQLDAWTKNILNAPSLPDKKIASFMGNLVDAVISVDWGMFVLVIACLALSYAALMQYETMQNGKSAAKNMLDGWKRWLFRRYAFAECSMPNWIYIVFTTGIILALLYNFTIINDILNMYNHAKMGF